MPTLSNESEPVDRASQTGLSWLAPLHHHLRWRFGWYQRWHTQPHAHKIHYGILALVIGVAISSVVASLQIASPVQATKTGNALIYYHSL